MIVTASEDACPACDERAARVLFEGTDRLYRTTAETFEVVECARCRLIRLYPWPAPAELGRYYPPSYWYEPTGSTAERAEEFYRRLVLRDHIAFVSQALEHSTGHGAVLDVGCGGGLLLSMLAQAGARVMGMDFSFDATRVAWHRNGVPAVVGSLTRAPLPAGCCSVVTMFHVLEHLYDPMSYLESAHRLLEPEGRLVVQVPNAGCWQFLLFGENWAGIDIPRHLINFRDSDLEALLDNAGFEVVRRKYFNIRDNPAGLATSLAPWLDPMARRIRAYRESAGLRLFKDACYFALVLACLPFTLMEAICRAGSTIMVEARKKR
jgi:SAM-dependent methyltransferase